MIPLVVVQGSEAAFRAAKANLRRQGWHVIHGWNSSIQLALGAPAPADPAKVVRTGTVANRTDAANAMLTALGGQGILIVARAEKAVIDTLCDDLRRLGPVDFRSGDNQDAPPQITDDDRDILRLMLQGVTLGQAAAALHLSRRTLDRRMAQIRRAYKVTRNAQTLTAARRQGDL